MTGAKWELSSDDAGRRLPEDSVMSASPITKGTGDGSPHSNDTGHATTRFFPTCQLGARRR
jgi:hypothetical protein